MDDIDNASSRGTYDCMHGLINGWSEKTDHKLPDTGMPIFNAFVADS